MLSNYHTHTTRCNHAKGTDREYVEQAIRAGMKVLGFSDHSPYVLPDGKPYKSGHRMRPEEAEGYAASVRALGEEYKEQIDVLLGVEIEYYPKSYGPTLQLLQQIDCDYLILGQHFIGEEDDYAGGLHGRVIFNNYIDQVLEALDTGTITYIAHPDLCLCPDESKVEEKGFVRLCERAKELGIPLEFNMYGMSDNRHYPCKRFYKIAAEVGNVIVAGSDAHSPHRLGDPKELQTMHAFAEACGFAFTELSVQEVLSRKTKIR